MYDDIILLRLQQRFRLELLKIINVLLIIQGQVLQHTFLSMLKEYCEAYFLRTLYLLSHQ